jgi:MFS family permease
LVYLGTDLNNRETSSGEKELITSLCSAGAFVGAIIAGLTADKFGRKMAIYVGCVLFTVGAILQASAYTIAQMAIGRLVVGFGVGSAAMVVPLYIAEIAPTKVRGRLIGLNNMSITGGQVLSYGIGAAFAKVPHGWRYMVGLGQNYSFHSFPKTLRLTRFQALCRLSSFSACCHSVRSLLDNSYIMASLRKRSEFFTKSTTVLQWSKSAPKSL